MSSSVNDCTSHADNSNSNPDGDIAPPVEEIKKKTESSPGHQTHSSPCSAAINGGNNGSVCLDQKEEDAIVSLDDVVAEEEALEADARAVLGGADETKCSYPEGYAFRQALYACGTCCPEKLAGICLACSYHCHDGHNLFELYTKRRFRCDCGNSMFPLTNPCMLEKGKDMRNPENKYNHNFLGRYCCCDRSYPDPDDSVADEQIQCIICEDWFHSR